MARKGVELRPEPKKQLRYLIDLDKQTFTPEEIRDMLPELQEFAAQAQPRKRLRTELNLSADLLDELSLHFTNPIEMEEWLAAPNVALENQSPLSLPHDELLRILRNGH